MFNLLYKLLWEKKDNQAREEALANMPPHFDPKNDKSGMDIPDLRAGAHKRN